MIWNKNRKLWWWHLSEEIHKSHFFPKIRHLCCRIRKTRPITLRVGIKPWQDAALTWPAPWYLPNWVTFMWLTTLPQSPVCIRNCVRNLIFNATHFYGVQHIQYCQPDYNGMDKWMKTKWQDYDIVQKFGVGARQREREMRVAGGIDRKTRLIRQPCKSEDIARMAANWRENSMPRKRSAGCYAALELCAICQCLNVDPVRPCTEPTVRICVTFVVCVRCVFYFDCVLMCMCIIIIICVRSFNRNKMKYVGKSSGARFEAIHPWQSFIKKCANMIYGMAFVLGRLPVENWMCATEPARRASDIGGERAAGKRCVCAIINYFTLHEHDRRERQ